MTDSPNHAVAQVSVVNEVEEDLHLAMDEFIAVHPQWDQYRLMQAAVAGFLFQNGAQERCVARHYLNGMFRRDPEVAGRQPHW